MQREREKENPHVERAHGLKKVVVFVSEALYQCVYRLVSSPDGHDTPFPFCLTPSCLSPDRRWFKPVLLNLSKDKRVLYRGSDKYKVLGLHMQDEI